MVNYLYFYSEHLFEQNLDSNCFKAYILKNIVIMFTYVEINIYIVMKPPISSEFRMF